MAFPHGATCGASCGGARQRAAPSDLFTHRTFDVVPTYPEHSESRHSPVDEQTIENDFADSFLQKRDLGGFIWHTAGRGKTLTFFKASTLLNRPLTMAA